MIIKTVNVQMCKSLKDFIYERTKTGNTASHSKKIFFHLTSFWTIIWGYLNKEWKKIYCEKFSSYSTWKDNEVI